jgi:hypothetical protein
VRTPEVAEVERPHVEDGGAQRGQAGPDRTAGAAKAEWIVIG